MLEIFSGIISKFGQCGRGESKKSRWGRSHLLRDYLRTLQYSAKSRLTSQLSAICAILSKRRPKLSLKIGSVNKTVFFILKPVHSWSSSIILGIKLFCFLDRKMKFLACVHSFLNRC